jgi:HEAT repeat protein
MAPESEIALLLEECRSGDDYLQIAAVQRLVELQAYGALTGIIEVLSSPDAIARSVAAEALGALGAHALDRVGPALLRLLDDPDRIARNAGVEALGALRYRPARDALEQALTVDPDWIVRASAAEALGSLGDVQALPILERALDDEYEPVRWYAADAIGLVASSDLIPWLGRRLRSESELEVKFALAGALYRLGSSEGLTWLLTLLKIADDESTFGMLNGIESLMYDRFPPSLAADAEALEAALLAVASKFPLTRGHVEDLVSRLRRLTGLERGAPDLERKG